MKWYRYRISPSINLDRDKREKLLKIIKEHKDWSIEIYQYYMGEKKVKKIRAYGVEKNVSSRTRIEFKKTDNNPYIEVDVYQSEPVSIFGAIAGFGITIPKSIIFSKPVMFIGTKGRKTFGIPFLEDYFDKNFIGEVIYFKEIGANGSQGGESRENQDNANQSSTDEYDVYIPPKKSNVPVIIVSIVLSILIVIFSVLLAKEVFKK